MKILLMTNVWGYGGGTEHYLIELSKSLSKLGHQVAVMCAKHSNTPLKEQLPLFEEYVFPCLAEYPKGHKDSGGDVLRNIERIKPDLIYLQKIQNYHILESLPQCSPTAARLHWPECTCLRNGTKTLYLSREICRRRLGFACYFHGCFISKPENGKLLPRINTLKNLRRKLDAYRRFDRIFVACNYMKDEMLNHNIDEKQIVVLPNSVTEFPNVELSRMKYDSKIILFIGRIDRYKGVDFLLEAATLFKEDFKLWIVGEGQYLDRCKRISDRLRLGNRVKFWGWVPNNEVYKFYLESTLVVIPSICPENFPFVGIEAASWARPVVAFDVGGMSDLVENGRTGFLVPPKDLIGLAQKVDLLLREHERARELGLTARLAVERKLNRENYLAQLVRNFEELIARRHQARCL